MAGKTRVSVKTNKLRGKGHRPRRRWNGHAHGVGENAAEETNGGL
jgi:hypothetical protein